MVRAIREDLMTRQFTGALLSEAIAMFIIIAFGDSVAAMYSLS